MEGLDLLWEKGFRFPTIEIPLDELLGRKPSYNGTSPRVMLALKWLIKKAGEVGGDGLGTVLELDFNRFWTNSLRTPNPYSPFVEKWELS